MERADKASRELEKVLASAGKEGNVKALYLMGKAKRMMREFLALLHGRRFFKFSNPSTKGHFDEAYEFLKRARDIEHNAEIGREMLIVDKELKKEETRRKELCGKMLGGRSYTHAPARLIRQDEKLTQRQKKSLIKLLQGILIFELIRKRRLFPSGFLFRSGLLWHILKFDFAFSVNVAQRVRSGIVQAFNFFPV